MNYDGDITVYALCMFAAAYDFLRLTVSSLSHGYIEKVPMPLKSRKCLIRCKLDSGAILFPLFSCMEHFSAFTIFFCQVEVEVGLT